MKSLLLIVFLVWCIEANNGMEMSSYYGPVPEPDPGQPYNKYHWVKSAMKKLQSGCLKGTPLDESDPTGSTGQKVCSLDSDEPLGMENGDILETDIEVSSTLDVDPVSSARLNYQGGWCASSGQDFTPWIQVNFNARVTITGLVTQGLWNFNNRISTYYVKYGDFASSLTYVTTSSGSVQLFSGNSDGDSHVSNWFASMLSAQFLRIEPVSCLPVNLCCMRFEVLGCR